MLRNRNPPIAANTQTAIALAPEKGALRKKRISISGSSRRSSYQINAPKHAIESTNNPTISPDSQPLFGPSMIEYVSDARATMTSTCPTGSKRRGCGARDSGTNRAVRMIATRPTGRLTRNTARQLKASTSAPPSTGPSAMLRPNTAPQTPIA